MNAVTFNDLIHLAVVIAGIWGFYKIIAEIIKAITIRHDKEQKWDETGEKMTEKYDKAISALNAKIDTNKTNMDESMREIRKELYVLTECMLGVLDGLRQLNCNGKVTESREILDQYMNERAHK